jgi:putative sigma-54 modulation protein
MNISITFRHMPISEPLREYAEKKLSAVFEHFPQVETCHIVLNVEKIRHIAEVVLTVKRHGRIEAKDESDGMYKSIDNVADKIERQLNKLREKKVDHKAGEHRTRLSDFEREINQG